MRTLRPLLAPALTLLSVACGASRAPALSLPEPAFKQSAPADAGLASSVVADAALSPPDAAAAEAPSCREQHPVPELLRSYYLNNGHGAHRDAIRRRTEWYGYFEGFGRPEMNPHPPLFYAERVLFFGIPVRLNRRIAPALACVEAELRRSCEQTHYRPHTLNGIRPANSFAGGEVSNHVYGIALDIDASRNPCCGCGEAFRSHPLCQGPARSIYDRTTMPECWVHAFERYGFFWGGNDRDLRDTMHFEFLGDPALIAPAATP